MQGNGMAFAPTLVGLPCNIVEERIEYKSYSIQRQGCVSFPRNISQPALKLVGGRKHSCASHYLPFSLKRRIHSIDDGGGWRRRCANPLPYSAMKRKAATLPISSELPLPFPSHPLFPACRSLSASDKFMDKYLACEM